MIEIKVHHDRKISFVEVDGETDSGFLLIIVSQSETQCPCLRDYDNSEEGRMVLVIGYEDEPPDEDCYVVITNVPFKHCVVTSYNRGEYLWELFVAVNRLNCDNSRKAWMSLEWLSSSLDYEEVEGFDPKVGEIFRKQMERYNKDGTL